MPTRFNSSNNNIDPEHNDEMWDLLSLYADGEASPEEAAHVERLLKSDVAYAKAFSFVRVTSSVVQDYTEIDPPESLRGAILASTTQRVNSGMRMAWLLSGLRKTLASRYTMSFASLAAAGLLVFVVFNNANRGPVDSTKQNVAALNHPRKDMPVTHKQADMTVASEPKLAVQPTLPPTVDGNDRPSAPVTRRLMNVAMQSKQPSVHLVADVPHATTVKPPAARHDDGGTVVSEAVYRPNMDAQFERTPDRIAMPDSRPTEIQGDDVQIADSDSSASTPSAHVVVDSAPAAPVVHSIVAKLTALPPDPNQVLTRADMARNRAALTSGYDRSTVRSMERKEASISLLRGTF